MDKIRFDVSRSLFISVNVTIAVNVSCLILQIFSLSRLHEAKEIYRTLELEEAEMKAEMETGKKLGNRK